MSDTAGHSPWAEPVGAWSAERMQEEIDEIEDTLRREKSEGTTGE